MPRCQDIEDLAIYPVSIDVFPGQSALVAIEALRN